MIELFLRKIWESKSRIFISAVTISLVVFLSVLFATMGMNVCRLMSYWFDTYPEYNYVYVEKGSSDSLLPLGDCAVESVAVKEEKIENLMIGEWDFSGISALVYPKENHSLIPGGTILAGKGELNEKSVLLGNSILSRLKLAPEEVIGKEVEVNSEKGYIISGVFDDSLVLKSVHCLIVTSEVKEPNLLLIHTSTALDVEKVQATYKAAGFQVTSFVDEIVHTENKIQMIEFGLILIAVLIVLASAMILWVSIRDFSEDVMPFLAILKAVGYQKRHFGLFVLMDSAMIFWGATILECVWTVSVFPLIKFILRIQNITEISGLDISALLNINTMAVVIVLVLQMLCTLAISLFRSWKIYAKSICDILHEVNQ